MPVLTPNGNEIYDDFKGVEQSRGFTAVFKPGEFEAPRTYRPKPSATFECSEVDGQHDKVKFKLTKNWPEKGLRINEIYHDTFPKFYQRMTYKSEELKVRGASKHYTDTKRNILPDLEDKKARISWWSAKPEDEDIKERRKLHESLCNSFAFRNSSNVKNRQGDLASERITCDLWDVINAYKESVIKSDDVGTVQLRSLGTFRYICEVMHAVLVCPADVPTGDFASFPIIKQKEGEPFEWEPYCTDSGRMWDHLSFAFYLRKGERIFIPKSKYSHETLSN